MESDELVSSNLELVLLLQTGRSLSDDSWQDIDAAHIDVWEKACDVLRSREYEISGGSIRLDFDWRPVVARLRQHYRVMEKLYDPNFVKKESLRFPLRHVRVACTATVNHKPDREGDAPHQGLQYAESFLHDAFLILNLAAPGCCAFYRATLRLRGGGERWMSHKLSLSEYSFDLAYLMSIEGGWPKAAILDLDVVSRWYVAIRSGANQVPQNRMEKVLFALLHICKAEVALDTIIWLFYALETLYDTQPGENRRALNNRIALVLQPNDKQRAHLKKQFRRLYDIRSGFAHGGHDIAHPMNDESLDRRVEVKYRELLDTAEFGFALLLASVQSAVANSAQEFRFAERLEVSKVSHGRQ